MDIRPFEKTSNSAQRVLNPKIILLIFLSNFLIKFDFFLHIILITFDDLFNETKIQTD
jgi:hypothetical protein